MTIAIKERGETAFQSPADESKGLKAGDRWTAGEGIVLKFRHSDLKKIEADRKAAGVPSFFNEFVERALAGTVDFDLMDLYVAHGAKGPDGNPIFIPESIMDEIPVHDIQELLFDALCWSMKGKSAKEHVDEIMGAFANGDDEGPTILPKGSS